MEKREAVIGILALISFFIAVIIFLIWFFILSSNNSGYVDLKFVIEDSSWDDENKLSELTVERGYDDANITGFNLIFDFEKGSVKHFVEELIDKGEKKVIKLNFSNFEEGNLVSIKIVPVFDGKEGRVTDEMLFEVIPKNNLGWNTDFDIPVNRIDNVEKTCIPTKTCGDYACGSRLFDGCRNILNCDCPTGKTCVDGMCVIAEDKPILCLNDSGCVTTGGFCDGNKPYTCSINSDGCLKRTNKNECSSGETCVNGECVSMQFNLIYYVDAVSGSDTTGDGSASKPWKTISKVYPDALNVRDNTMVILKPGSYGTFRWSASKNQNHIIIYKSLEKHKAVFDRIDIGGSTLFDYKLKFQDVKVHVQPGNVPSPDGEKYSENGPLVLSKVNDFSIERCFLSGYDKYRVSGSTVSDSKDILFHMCEITGQEAAIQSYGTENLRIVGNYIHGIGSASTIRIGNTGVQNKNTLIERNHFRDINTNSLRKKIVDIKKSSGQQIEVTVDNHGLKSGDKIIFFGLHGISWKQNQHFIGTRVYDNSVLYQATRTTSKKPGVSSGWENDWTVIRDYHKAYELNGQMYSVVVTGTNTFKLVGTESKSITLSGGVWGHITTEIYMPFNDFGTDRWHPGSMIAIRSPGVIIRGNIAHDTRGVSQTIYTYRTTNFIPPYHRDILVENNLFYDNGGGSMIRFENLGPSIEYPIIIRNNNFIGEFRDERDTITTIGLRHSKLVNIGFQDTYVKERQAAGDSVGKGLKFYNNIVVGAYPLPYASHGSSYYNYESNNNLYWSKSQNIYIDSIGFEGKAIGGDWYSNSRFAVWREGNSLMGNKNFFENGFFVNPGFKFSDSFPQQRGQVFDFRLSSGSPGINFGDSKNQPLTSLGSIGPDGFIREDGPARSSSRHSVGAYEHT
jgi:hypothetical protein